MIGVYEGLYDPTLMVEMLQFVDSEVIVLSAKNSKLMIQ